MYRLWKEAPEQWLLKSKIGWSTRHESRRAPARTAAPSVAAGRASRVWEGVRRRRPDHQHQQAREHRLGDAGRRDRRAPGAAWFRSRCSSPQA